MINARIDICRKDNGGSNNTHTESFIYLRKYPEITKDISKLLYMKNIQM